MTTADQDRRAKIIEKLRKMRAHAESAAAIGSEDEALAFAATMRRLMDENQILMSEIEAASARAGDPVVEVWTEPAVVWGRPAGSRRVDWRDRLARVVAEAHGCRIVVEIGSTRTAFVGRRETAEAARAVFEYLAKCAAAASLRAYAKAKAEGHDCRGFHASFLLGFSSRLSERYAEERERVRREWASRGSALMRLDDLEPVNQYLARFKTRVRRQTSNLTFNARGFLDGKDAVDEMKLGGEAKRLR